MRDSGTKGAIYFEENVQSPKSLELRGKDCETGAAVMTTSALLRQGDLKR